jgi:hypothetical protein
MVTKIPVFVFALMFSVVVSHGAAALEPKGWSALYGVGNNLTPTGTVRVGYEQWEFGKLNNWAYGAIKNFYFSESYYTGFGFVLMPTQSGTALGLVAALGANWGLFWGFSLRLEISANANSNANLFQQGILGIGYDF